MIRDQPFRHNYLIEFIVFAIKSVISRVSAIAAVYRTILSTPIELRTLYRLVFLMGYQQSLDGRLCVGSVHKLCVSYILIKDLLKVLGK